MTVERSHLGQELQAMKLVKPSRFNRVLARLVVVSLILIALVLTFTPWQQSVPGAGRVIAFSPTERQQNIKAPIQGIIVNWHVSEGAYVEKGAPIVEMADNDPSLMDRLRQERDAISSSLDSAKAKAQSEESRVVSLESSKTAAIAAAESRIRMARDRVAAAEQSVALAQTSLDIAVVNAKRQRGLQDKGITSQRDFELTILEETRARTELERAKVALTAAKSEQAALVSERSKVENDATAALNDAKAKQSSAEVDVAKASVELARVEVRLARQSSQSVVAPIDGYILKIVANGHQGELLKPGDVLAEIVPETPDRAVEMWISGNDMPLVHEGARTRIQFEGWPALQFSGWPSVAVGTFPGRVSFVDASDNGAGLFRVVISPEEGSQWPEPIYLRQGVRVQGWVQLGWVRLGYELWRQLNGFPPSLASAPKLSAAKGKKGAQ